MINTRHRRHAIIFSVISTRLQTWQTNQQHSITIIVPANAQGNYKAQGKHCDMKISSCSGATMNLLMHMKVMCFMLNYSKHVFYSWTKYIHKTWGESIWYSCTRVHFLLVLIETYGSCTRTRTHTQCTQILRVHPSTFSIYAVKIIFYL